MRSLICLATVAVLFSLATAQADTLSPEPEPGLWRHQSTTLINGQDLQLAMRNAQQQMLQTLPAEQRKVMEAMMDPVADRGPDMECISPQMAADLTSPEALLERARDDMKECELTIEKVSSSSMAIAGSCAGNEEFTGDVQGELTIVSRREMRSSFSGTGTLKMDAEQIPPAMQGMAGNQPVAIVHNQVSTWVSEDCADLEPRS